MAFSKFPEDLPPCKTDGPGIFCDECKHTITATTCFYHGRGPSEPYDICLTCVLTAKAPSRHHGLLPCVVDTRDNRRTFIPGPGLSEFRSVVAKLEEDPLYRLPMRYYRFFHQSGLSARDLASTGEYEDPDEDVPVTTKMIENDYTIYGPLREKEIRLVLLMPGPVHDPLIVVLHPVPYPWNDQHPYTALSYTWGSLEETRLIFIGQMNRCGDDLDQSTSTKGLSCTASLEIALRGLRDENQPVWLWIDALCINQGSLEERGHQVPLMAEIYSHARRVAVWLGAPREINLAGAYVDGLGRFLKMCKEAIAEEDEASHGGGCDLRDEYHVFEHMVDSLKAGDHPLSTHRLTANAVEFMSNPWFSRAWVVQEVWAARDLVVLCGSTESLLSWQTIKQVNMYLFARAHRVRSVSSQAVDNTFKKAAYRSLPSGKAIWNRLKKEPFATDAPIPASELLDMVTTQLQASDPRDLLFSTLGLSVEAGGTSTYHTLIAPDYTKPPWQVFSDFTRWHIRYYQSLNILGQVSYTRRGPIGRLGGSVPSWCISPELIHGFGGGGMICDRPNFHADADIPLDIDLVGDAVGDRHLIARGFTLDTITWVDDCCFCPMINFQSFDASEFAPFPWRISSDQTVTRATCGVEWLWKTVREKHGVDVCNGQDQCNCHRALEAVLDALTCGRCMTADLRFSVAKVPVANTTYKLYGRSDIYSIFASYWVASTGDSKMTQFCDQLRGMLLPLVKESRAKIFADGGMEGACRRSLFMTTSGAMGICSPLARPGDYVVILFGCRAPVILSKRDLEVEVRDSWAFVGECYLHDLMDGEAVGKMVEADETVQTYNLY